MEDKYMDEIFIPKKIIEKDGIEYVLLDNVFKSEETLKYAVAHNFHIKFICTTYTCACEILADIQEQEYHLSFKKVPEYIEGSKICDKIVVYCYKID